MSCSAPFEQQLDRPGRLTAAGRERFYLRLAGVRPLVDCADPDPEVISVETEARPAVLTVNHGQHPVEIRLMHLGPKEWAVTAAR